MIKSELLRKDGILIVTPEGPLAAADFEELARKIDPYIKEKGGLHGLMIYTESFPGWQDFSSLISHLTFVRDHERHIAKVAAVTDSGFLSIMPRIVEHFVQADVRHFDYADKAEAMKWLSVP
jgi:hypothetical protein